VSLRVEIRKKFARGFCLDIAFETDGEALGILGESGSGKSMTLKCAAGIETPDAGFIALDGRTLFDSANRVSLPPQRRRTGYLFQNYALFPRMTVLENICAALAGRDKEGCAARWIERFGLVGLERRYPRQLSGGQQQRAALARMLAVEPDAVLLDEPFSALDATLREYMQLQLQELLAGGGAAGATSPPVRNAVLVTHNRDEVYRICPRLAVISGGRILVTGRTRDVFENPRFVEAAKLTGCKNISPVERLSETDVFARDWGLRLRTQGVPADCTHVGIRAHDFVPVAASERRGFNEVRLAAVRTSSEPFEDAVIFTNASARTASERAELWWKYSRYLRLQVPDTLFLPPERLLLLKE
jgi:molybdate transport system ATP-binding protein